ncbi:helix-turn-helix domain-containing protein [Pseudomonas sp. N040]|uniref:helix-turn-helix domain-containing protein n=1 Tax=Pseudomonas sp. N040 TaxID=2785325 RepID=UPI0018A284A5|nr:helix-turn-helix transcriptional regulator [Pseudomonas sp. N040]MBF7729784.1 helix-turn-helix transcriptional regulator [Pseudomonas sp. N040]MBW7013426.1 helix-turn-helix domain-containing protein [Pseudomonas sp. N040]
MNVQVIMREGQPEYAVLPWAEYQALLQAATGRAGVVEGAPRESPGELARLAQLTALRESRSMSREDLARAVGISPHYLALFESGERRPDGAIARALARALGVAGWEGVN